MASSIKDKLVKVADCFSVNRYENGYMIDIYGRDKNGDTKTVKIISTTEAELLNLIKEINAIELDN